MQTREIAELLKARGVRPTPQRLGVYRFLYENPVHATAEQIYEQLLPQYPSFSKTTIYNSIKTLVECGLVRPVVIDEGFTRYDADVADHGHFKCRKCGRVYDFPLAWGVGQPESLKQFQISSRDAYFYGLCPACVDNKTTVG